VGPDGRGGSVTVRTPRGCSAVRTALTTIAIKTTVQTAVGCQVETDGNDARRHDEREVSRREPADGICNPAAEPSLHSRSVRPG